MVKSVRGAITVSENTEEAVEKAVNRLMGVLIEKNRIRKNQILSVIFSLTRDVTAANPAAMLRKGGGYDKTPFFTLQEAYIDGAPEKLIRILLQIRSGPKKIKAVYLDGAKKLRPDLGID